MQQQRGIYTYVQLERQLTIKVFADGSGPVPGWVYSPDGLRWRRHMSFDQVPGTYVPNEGDYVLVPMTLDNIPELAVAIGERMAGELPQFALDEIINQVAHGLARDAEIYGAGRLTTFARPQV